MKFVRTTFTEGLNAVSNTETELEFRAHLLELAKAEPDFPIDQAVIEIEDLNVLVNLLVETVFSKDPEFITLNPKLDVLDVPDSQLIEIEASV